MNIQIETEMMMLEDKNINPVVLQQKPKCWLEQVESVEYDEVGCDVCGEFKPNNGEVKNVDLEYEGDWQSMCFECRQETNIVMCETCPYLLCTGEDDDLDIWALGYKTEENGIFCPSCVDDGKWAKKTRKLRAVKKGKSRTYNTDYQFEWIDKLA